MIRSANHSSYPVPPGEARDEATEAIVVAVQSRAFLDIVTDGQVRFTEITRTCRTRIEVIATFMALLELVRQGELQVRQYEELGDIWLFAREPASQPAGMESDA